MCVHMQTHKTNAMCVEPECAEQLHVEIYNTKINMVSIYIKYFHVYL